MKITTWTCTSHGSRTHALVGPSTTWCGRFVPQGAKTMEYVVAVPLPFDCQSCEKAWLSRPRKGTR
jgi:hypothetical protein